MDFARWKLGHSETLSPESDYAVASSVHLSLPHPRGTEQTTSVVGTRPTTEAQNSRPTVQRATPTGFTTEEPACTDGRLLNTLTGAPMTNLTSSSESRTSVGLNDVTGCLVGQLYSLDQWLGGAHRETRAQQTG